MVEGYHIFVGGGYGTEQEIGREIYRDVQAEDAPADRRADAARLPRRTAQRRARRSAPSARRHDTERAQGMFDAQRSRVTSQHRSPPMHAIHPPRKAPFTPEQRAWLNGFFAGLLGSSAAARLARRLRRR